MTNTPSGSPATSVLSKILIPVITTVLGATAIYFLGFNRSSGRSSGEKMLVTKEATIQAWKSFVATQNIGYKNAKSIGEEYEKKMVEAGTQDLESMIPVIEDFKVEWMRESKKTTADIENILKKEEDIDRDLVSMLNRMLDNQNVQDEKAAGILDDFITLVKSKRTREEKMESLQKAATKFTIMEDKENERAANEAEVIAKTLSDRYNQAFDLNELLVYAEYKKTKGKTTDENTINTNDNTSTGTEPEKLGKDESAINNKNETEPTVSLLTGKWEMTNGYLELSANGDMYWSFTGKGYTSGDWKLVNERIQMNAINPDTKKSSYIVGTLSDVTTKSFTLTVMATPKEVYHFRKNN